MKKHIFFCLMIISFFCSNSIAITTELASVAPDGAGANGGQSFLSMSADGEHVAFNSSSTNLISSDTNGRADIFVFNKKTRQANRVSIANDGTQANGDCYRSAITNDGRYVVFESFSNNLDGFSPWNTISIYMHDRLNNQTRRVNIASDGTPAEMYSQSLYPSVDSNGQFVVFSSGAANLVQNDTNSVYDIFIHDTVSGVTERIMSNNGTEANGGHSSRPAISANGRFITFDSEANNLVDDDTNGVSDVFVLDKETNFVKRVSIGYDGNQSNGYSLYPSISADGRFIAFESGASNLIPSDTNNAAEIFVFDLVIGQTIASIPGGMKPSISANGRFVAFASNYINNQIDTNGKPDIYVFDLLTRQTDLVSKGVDGLIGNNESFHNIAPAISKDGRYVAFNSSATNLVSGDSNSLADVFIRDRSSIKITNATYRSSKDLLKIEATSSFGALAFLELENFGPMTFARGKWSISINPAGGNPGVVTVSGFEGSETSLVP